MSGASRLSIPIELERRVKTEAGHRCAIPTCRQWPVELAHIVPYRTAKSHSFDNLIALCPTCHTRYDNSKDIDLASMRYYKARLAMMDFVEPEEHILQPSELECSSQKEEGPFSHFSLLSQWFNKLSEREQLKFYQVVIISITALIIMLRLYVGLTMHDRDLPGALITSGLVVASALALLFFIRRECRDDVKTV